MKILQQVLHQKQEDHLYQVQEVSLQSQHFIPVVSPRSLVSFSDVFVLTFFSCHVFGLASHQFRLQQIDQKRILDQDFHLQI